MVEVFRVFKKNAGVIYGIVDSRSDRICYVGKAVDESSRKSSHANQLANGNHCNRRLQNIYNKLARSDEDCLYWMRLEVVQTEYLADAEIAWIARLKNCGFDLCNATDGGEGTIGRIVSKETRQKISSKKSTYNRWKSKLP